MRHDAFLRSQAPGRITKSSDDLLYGPAFKYSDDQPRDEDGKFGGGPGDSAGTSQARRDNARARARGEAGGPADTFSKLPPASSLRAKNPSRPRR